MKDYINLDETDPQGVPKWIRYASKERTKDVQDWNNLTNRFISGRIVAKVPVGASDVSDTDRVGDTNFDYASGFEYRLVNNAGVAVWARIPLDTGW
jgi:hypothetical protein